MIRDGQCIHTIFSYEVDMVLRIVQAIEGTKAIVGMKSYELGWFSICVSVIHLYSLVNEYYNVCLFNLQA